MRSRRGGAGAVVVIATCILLAGCGAQSRFDSHMRRGQAYFSQGDWAKASVEFRNAMQILPKDTTARVMGARVSEQLGRARDAVALYQSVLDSAPDNTEARERLARLLVAGGAEKAALQIIAPGLAKRPNDAALLTLRAAARTQLDDLQGATADADRALQLEPASEDAIQVRAGLYKRAGDLKAAIGVVEGGLRRIPQSRGLHEALMDLYGATGQPALAEGQLRELIRLAPNELDYRIRLARGQALAGKLDEAQQVLEQAVKALPRSNEAKLALVDFLSARRTRAQGEQTLRRFISEEPDNYPLRLGLGGLLQRSGDLQGAEATYREVVRLDGTGADGLTARDRLATMMWSQHREQDARRLIGEVLQANPRDSDALVLSGEIALQKSDSAAAISDFREVLRDHPDSIAVRRLLARAYVIDRQPALAIEALRSALDLAPGDTNLRLELAQLLIQGRQTDQAVSVLEEAARRAPSDARVQTDLARAYLQKKDFASARTAALLAGKLRPDAATGAYLAGLADVGLNRPDEAQEELERALTIEPQAVDALTALARLEQARGRLADGIARVKSAVDHGGATAVNLELLGELYLAQKNAALASQTLARAAAAAPAWWLPYRNLALAKLASADVEGAVEAYRDALKVAPGEYQLVGELGMLYQSRGRVDDALALYDDWHRKYPQAQGVTENLARLLVSYKTDRASLDRARDLTEAFAGSSDAGLLDVCGWVHFKRAEYAEALPLLQRAIDLEPGSKEIRYHLGMAELRSGETDRARGDLEASLAGSAKFFGADEARVTLAALRNRAG